MIELNVLSNYLIVGLGGGLGAIARVFFSRILPETIFSIPLPILLINVIGCFIMGLLTELIALYWDASTTMRYLILSGFLGGFTTFSSFALECGTLLEKNSPYLAAAYAALSFGCSIVAFIVGLKIIRAII